MAHVTRERDPGLVTVVICVYNAGDFLRPAVKSILNQTYTNIELLIVDDGSTDGCLSTIQDLRDPRIRILHQENRGKPAAMNHALSELRGEFYAIQDADDLSFPQRIEKQLQCMREHPDIAAVFCGFELILNGRHIAPTCAAKDSARCRRDIEEMSMPAHDPTAMYRVTMVRDVRYDESLRIGEGYDYILRVGERFPMRVLGECLYSYRINWEALTKQDPILRQRLLRDAVIKVFERRGLPCDESQLPELLDPHRMKNRHQDNDIVSHFMTSTADLRHAGKWGAAVHVAVTCLALHPLDPYYYKPVAYAVAPLRMIDWYRARKSARRANEHPPQS
jgi:glycosyltransferase involved in cell wall biosynthesis